VNNEQGGKADGLRVFAGRLDPFFFDGVKAAQAIVTGQLESYGSSGADPERSVR